MELTDNKIQVCIVAKQFLYRLGIKTILSVIGIEPEIFEFSAYDALKRHLIEKPNAAFVILTEDVSVNSMDGGFIEIMKISPKAKILFIGEGMGNSTHTYLKNVFNADNQKEVLDKFQEFFFEPQEEEQKEDQKQILSDREIDVLKTVALGYSNKEIADKLFISINTVITHRKNITEKLGIKTIAGLTVYAMMNEIINPDEVRF